MKWTPCWPTYSCSVSGSPPLAKAAPTLAHDTATALVVVIHAARGGVELDFTDPLCAAVALRLGLLLLAAGDPPPPPNQPKSEE
ncbi:hypothetical protein ACFRKE_01095 [Kitasatospora indigofera]|uniref:hypothetical protein n=1 Tax=Kitasatospora indigofera TaxID=67307 RepID=UPI0036AC4F70